MSPRKPSCLSPSTAAKLRSMKITIDVRSLKCSRCSTTAPVRPQLLYPSAAVDPVFAAPMSELLRVQPRTEHRVTDDAGQVWVALLTSLPIGWTTLPTKEDGALCTECAAAWASTAKAFMTPPPPAPVEEEVSVLAENTAEDETPVDRPRVITQAPPASSLNPVMGSYRSK